MRATILAAALLLAGCYIETQRYPGPMEPATDPLPPGTTDLFPEGPEEVLVIRHADPVLLRAAGRASSYPLHFYDKQARINAGSWVFTGTGGRAEILFSNGSSVILFGRGSAVVGSASRGEPIVFLQEVENARIDMQEGEQVQLFGGAVLAADTGPFALEHDRKEILRIRNRSKGTGRVAFRDVVFEIDPGEVLDLPLLEVGGEPFERDPSFETLVAGGVPIDVRGDVEIVDDPAGTRLRALGEHELVGYGVRVRLDPGEEVVFCELSTAPLTTASFGGSGLSETERAEAPPEPDTPVD